MRAFDRVELSWYLWKNSKYFGPFSHNASIHISALKKNHQLLSALSVMRDASACLAVCTQCGAV